MARPPTTGPELQRHQRRALHAYRSVAEVSDEEFDHYKTAIHALGANIQRSGLAAAMSVLEQANGKAADRHNATMKLRGHLGSAGVPGLAVTAEALPATVRALSLDNYILATRELLQVVLWLRRAVQAKRVQ